MYIYLDCTRSQYVAFADTESIFKRFYPNTTTNKYQVMSLILKSPLSRTFSPKIIFWEHLLCVCGCQFSDSSKHDFLLCMLCSYTSNYKFFVGNITNASKKTPTESNARLALLFRFLVFLFFTNNNVITLNTWLF